MGKISDIIDAAITIRANTQSLEIEIHALAERNMKLVKALATIKNNLERGIKHPQNLASAVYDAVDLARSLTPYTEMSTGVTKLDPPLTQEEKTLKITVP